MPDLMHWLKQVCPAENVGPSLPSAVGAAGTPGIALRSRPSGMTPLVSTTPIGMSAGSASGGTVGVTITGVGAAGSPTTEGADVVVVVVVLGLAIIVGSVVVVVVVVVEVVGVASRGVVDVVVVVVG